MIRTLRQQLEIKRAYQRLFDSEDGQLVLKDLAAQAGITHRPSCETNTDLLLIREGQQRIVYSILRMARTDEKQILEQIEKLNQQPDNPYDL